MPGGCERLHVELGGCRAGVAAADASARFGRARARSNALNIIPACMCRADGIQRRDEGLANTDDEECRGRLLAMSRIGVPTITLWRLSGGKNPNFVFYDDSETMIGVVRAGKIPTICHLERTHGICMSWMHRLSRKALCPWRTRSKPEWQRIPIPNPSKDAVSWNHVCSPRSQFRNLNLRGRAILLPVTMTGGHLERLLRRPHFRVRNEKDKRSRGGPFLVPQLPNPRGKFVASCARRLLADPRQCDRLRKCPWGHVSASQAHSGIMRQKLDGVLALPH